MRGQAFVSFADVESANEAKKDVSEFPLYGKPIVCCAVLLPLVSFLASFLPALFSPSDNMSGTIVLTSVFVVQQISFARGRSDSVVKKLQGDEEFAQHKVHRLEQKSTSGSFPYP